VLKLSKYHTPPLSAAHILKRELQAFDFTKLPNFKKKKAGKLKTFRLSFFCTDYS